jgi:hypothetical protein
MDVEKLVGLYFQDKQPEPEPQKARGILAKLFSRNEPQEEPEWDYKKHEDYLGVESLLWDANQRSNVGADGCDRVHYAVADYLDVMGTLVFSCGSVEDLTQCSNAVLDMEDRLLGVWKKNPQIVAPGFYGTRQDDPNIEFVYGTLAACSHLISNKRELDLVIDKLVSLYETWNARKGDYYHDENGMRTQDEIADDDIRMVFDNLSKAKEGYDSLDKLKIFLEVAKTNRPGIRLVALGEASKHICGDDLTLLARFANLAKNIDNANRGYYNTDRYLTDLVESRGHYMEDGEIVDKELFEAAFAMAPKYGNRIKPFLNFIETTGRDEVVEAMLGLASPDKVVEASWRAKTSINQL